MIRSTSEVLIREAEAIIPFYMKMSFMTVPDIDKMWEISYVAQKTE